jgi:hypothetical protein
MTPVQTTPILAADTAQESERAAIRTRSETVECNCPEHCERDHEVD